MAAKPSKSDYVLVGFNYLYLQDAKYIEAIAEFTKAIDINPNDDIAYLYRGLAYACNENFENGIADFSRAIEINKYAVTAYYYRS